MFAPNEQIALTIDRPAAGGRMIARLDGRIVFVGGAIPGEKVIARVERVAKGIVFAETLQVEQPSPDRREPSADPLCGGCLYSHISYPRQLAIKSQVLADAFTRIGHLTLPSRIEVVPSPEEGYRMRARLHVRDQRVGFFREGTHEICDARQTRQLLSKTCDTLDRLTSAMRSLGVESIREVELSENVDATERVVHLGAAGGLDRAALAPRTLEALMSVEGLTAGPYVNDELVIDNRPLRLRRHVQAFFQGNRYLLRDLVAHVADRVPIGSALLDLYAGAGLFSIAAASLRGASVSAIEGDRFAAADLHVNASASGGQLTTIHAPVEDFLNSYRVTAGLPQRGPAVETIIVDPPRTGMSRQALEATLRLAASRVIYVSCDVATLARDSRRIVDAGYAIERIDGFDLFPNTPHLEAVVVFQSLG